MGGGGAGKTIRANALGPRILKGAASEKPSATVADVDSVGGPLGVLVDLGRDDANPEFGPLHALVEELVLACGPHRHASPRFQCSSGRAHPFAGVEGVIGIPDHATRTVVNVEKDGVVGVGVCFADDRFYVGDFQVDPPIIEKCTVEAAQETAVPFGDFRDQFHNVDAGIGLDRVQNRSQAEAETESSDEDVGFRSLPKLLHGGLAEKKFGGRCAGVHKLLTSEADGKIAVLLMENHGLPIGTLGFSKLDAWFHFSGPHAVEALAIQYGGNGGVGHGIFV